MAAGIHVFILLHNHSTNYVKLYLDANVVSYSKRICDIHHFFKIDIFNADYKKCQPYNNTTI